MHQRAFAAPIAWLVILTACGQEFGILDVTNDPDSSQMSGADSGLSSNPSTDASVEGGSSRRDGGHPFDGPSLLIPDDSAAGVWHDAANVNPMVDAGLATTFCAQELMNHVGSTSFFCDDFDDRAGVCGHAGWTPLDANNVGPSAWLGIIRSGYPAMGGATSPPNFLRVNVPPLGGNPPPPSGNVPPPTKYDVLSRNVQLSKGAKITVRLAMQITQTGDRTFVPLRLLFDTGNGFGAGVAISIAPPVNGGGDQLTIDEIVSRNIIDDARTGTSTLLPSPARGLWHTYAITLDITSAGSATASTMVDNGASMLTTLSKSFAAALSTMPGVVMIGGITTGTNVDVAIDNFVID